MRGEERRREEKKSTKLVKKNIDQSSRLGRSFWGFIPGAFFEQVFKGKTIFALLLGGGLP